MQLNPALALLTSLALAGCASATPLPGTSVLLEELPVVHNSTKSPCWQQREIAAQRSYIDTITKRREVVYAAPCDVDKGSAQKVVAANG